MPSKTLRLGRQPEVVMITYATAPSVGLIEAPPNDAPSAGEPLSVQAEAPISSPVCGELSVKVQVTRQALTSKQHFVVPAMALKLIGAGCFASSTCGGGVPEITDTCKVCRHWARPSPDAKPSCRMVIGFNIEIEGDLMFYRHKGVQRILLVLTDRGVQWTTASEVDDKQTAALLTAIDAAWVAIFGPPQVLIFDGETGLDDAESATFFQLRGITKRTAAPRQHTRIVDRKICSSA